MLNQSILEGERRTLEGIQYLRAIAALLVVIDHASGMIALPWYFGSFPAIRYLRFGSVGVDLFFVISGFIIVFISLDGKPCKRKVPLKEFLKRRFVRIFPFLWFCVASYAALRFLGRGTFYPLPYLRAVILFPVGEVNPHPVWTLRHEMLFYVVFGLSLLTRSPRFWMLIIWLISPILFLGMSAHLDFGYGFFALLVKLVLNPINLLFGCGMAVGLLIIKREVQQSKRINLGFGSALVTALMIFGYANIVQYDRTQLGELLLSGILFALTVKFFAEAKEASVKRLDQVGRLLGDASFSIYLTHEIFISAWLGLASRYFPRLELFVVLGISVILVIICGVIVHLLLERPIIAFAQRLLPHKPPQFSR